MNSETSQPNSIVGLLQTLRDETTTLLRQEVALAKAEVSENISKTGKHAAALAAGGTMVNDSYARAFWVLADPEGNEACLCTWEDRG